MRLQFVQPWNSITSPVTPDEIADFIVLTGLNGSGKSNLLGAIQAGATSIDELTPPGQPFDSPQVRLVALGDLVVPAPGPQTASSFRDTHLRLVEAKAHLLQVYERGQSGLKDASPDDLEAWIVTALVAGRHITADALARMKAAAGKHVRDFTIDDFRLHAPPLVGIRDAFSIAVGEIFLTYADRRARQRYALWHAERYRTDDSAPLDDDAFVERFGPPPWDLLNDVLAVVGLDYRFDSPHDGIEEVQYEAHAIHHDGSRVTLDQLSSGEKTLMALTLSLYVSRHLREHTAFPKVLLLDEPDASLHPSMTQQLLRIAHEIFHVEHGVKVIMTTHSPTTVALAPADSLYVITRSGTPRLQPASRDNALRSLTVGIPALSVRMENRRQVFVESEYDEACFQEYFRILRPTLDSTVSLEFIASGKGDSGGCDAVHHLVSRLRRHGNTSVWGVVDRDTRSEAPAGIEFIPSRYALENVTLDPLGVATLLLRDKSVKPQDLSVPEGSRHFELGGTCAQALCTFVCSAVQQPGDDLELTAASYAGAFTVQVPRFYLETPGHQLEARLTEAFPSLKKYKKNLKLAVIMNALGDVPAFIPSDVVRLFERLQTMDPAG